MMRLENTLKTTLQDALNMSWKKFWRRFCKMPWRSFEDVLKMPWRRFCRTSWGLQNVFKIFCKDFLKTSWRGMTRRNWSWPRRLDDVFWRFMAKANIFALTKTYSDVLKTSFEDEDERPLHDECLLGLMLKVQHLVKTGFGCPTQWTKKKILNIIYLQIPCEVKLHKKKHKI